MEVVLEPDTLGETYFSAFKIYVVGLRRHLEEGHCGGESEEWKERYMRLEKVLKKFIERAEEFIDRTSSYFSQTSKITQTPKRSYTINNDSSNKAKGRRSQALKARGTKTTGEESTTPKRSPNNSLVVIPSPKSLSCDENQMNEKVKEFKSLMKNEENFPDIKSPKRTNPSDAITDFPPFSDPPLVLENLETFKDQLPVIATTNVPGFTIESEVDTKEHYELQFDKIEDIYKNIYSDRKHYNWVACNEEGEHFIVSVLCQPSLQGYRALVNSKSGFSEFYIPVESQTDHSHAGVTKKLSSILRKYLKTRYLNTQFLIVHDVEAINDFLTIEKKNPQVPDKVSVALVYCEKGQISPLEMLNNRNVSEKFLNFLRRMGVPIRNYKLGTNCSSYWRGLQIIWYPAPFLSNEEQRQYIGNTIAVIYFKDYSTTTATPTVPKKAANQRLKPNKVVEPFNPSDIHEMGSLGVMHMVVVPFYRAEGTVSRQASSKADKPDKVSSSPGAKEKESVEEPPEEGRARSRRVVTPDYKKEKSEMNLKNRAGQLVRENSKRMKKLTPQKGEEAPRSLSTSSKADHHERELSTPPVLSKSEPKLEDTESEASPMKSVLSVPTLSDSQKSVSNGKISVEERYRVGFIHRESVGQFSPEVPKNSLFDGMQIRDFLLTKVFNGYIASMRNPPLDRFFQEPRLSCIKEITKDYIPKNWPKPKKTIQPL